ncbi:MAG: deoxyribonuclease V [Sedimentisphaerales bacterium]|nr:deoxyribonuclease V [Sedimentisphaerales bacterium]
MRLSTTTGLTDMITKNSSQKLKAAIPMKIKQLHRWDVSMQEARILQKELAAKVNFKPLKKIPRLIAGLDCAFSKNGCKIYAIAVVMKFDDFQIVETAHTVIDVTFPYISGLLSFREAPACIDAVKKLKSSPDVFIIDGQGIAHPRRLGLACHLGLFFGKPTIGCAKSRLWGTFEDVEVRKGSYKPLKDKTKIIGAVLRTRTNVKPVFVSPGNKCTADDARKIVLACAVKYRLPEPTRMAHKLVSELKLKFNPTYVF